MKHFVFFNVLIVLTGTLELFAQCDASFTAFIDSTNRLHVSPKDTSSDTYYWEFGEGKVSSQQKNVVLYERKGTHKVQLIVTKRNPACTDTSVLFVRFGGKQGKPCHAGFGYAYSPPNTRNRFTFHTDASNNSKTKTWEYKEQWFSSEFSQTIVLNLVGKHYFRHIVNDTLNSCRDTMETSITVDSNYGGYCEPFYSFRELKDGKVEFACTNFGYKVKWSINNLDVSNNQFFSHVFRSGGWQDVCLTVSDSTESCKKTVCFKVNVQSVLKKCNASFEIGQDSTTKFKLKLINKSAKNPSYSYNWSFGDGGSSSLRNPTYVYQSFGRYQICLTVTDGTCTSIFCDSIGMDSTGKMLKNGAFEIEVTEGNMLSKLEHQGYSWHISPNPVIHSFKIQTDQPKVRAKAYVTDQAGRLIDTFKVGEIVEINASNWQPGVYYLIIQSKGSSHHKKLIKY